MPELHILPMSSYQSTFVREQGDIWNRVRYLHTEYRLRRCTPNCALIVRADKRQGEGGGVRRTRRRPETLDFTCKNCQSFVKQSYQPQCGVLGFIHTSLSNILRTLIVRR